MRCYLFTSSFSLAAILVVAFLNIGALVADQSNTVVNVGVYYESQCVDSIRWIEQQLLGSYDKLKEHINVDLVPYGKASHRQIPLTGLWHFTCQHGTLECEGNMAQACGIYAIQKGEQADRVQELSVALVGCVMSSVFPPSAVEECAKKVGVSKQTQDSIDNCIKGPMSSYLLAGNGDKTAALNPPLSFVPTITINGVTSREIQKKALHNFFKLICDTLADSAKPSECSSA